MHSRIKRIEQRLAELEARQALRERHLDPAVRDAITAAYIDDPDLTAWTDAVLDRIQEAGEAHAHLLDTGQVAHEEAIRIFGSSEALRQRVDTRIRQKLRAEGIEPPEDLGLW